MIEFAHPEFLLLLLLLPLLAWLKGKHGAQPAFLYSSTQLVRGLIGLSQTRAGRVQRHLRWVTLGLLILGLARPRQDESETSLEASGVDIVLALDLSRSMEALDFQLRGERVNRVTIAKEAMRQFIGNRPSDRMGLIAFAGAAYIASPLTLDHEFLLQHLDRLNTRQLQDGTAIGSAIAASLNRLREVESKSKIVILMTDGQNTAGTNPITPAEAARALGVKIYCIGVGTRGTAPVPQVDQYGQTRGLSYQPVDIDEDTLQKIASLTGGKYYRADNTETLREIYGEIDRLEKTEFRASRYEKYQELFHWAVIPGLVLLLLEMVLNHTLWRRIP